MRLQNQNYLRPPSMMYSSSDGLHLLRHLSQSHGSSSKHIPTTTTTKAPQPVLWFPGNNADCGGSTKGSDSISTFSLLALLFSIFNIINVVASNVNNNNNRNNINDNSGNVNTADNTESNANSGSMTATQVMMVPPGVGRRKRSSFSNEPGKLEGNENHLILTQANETLFQVDMPQWTPQMREEVPLGIIVSLNAWQLADHSGKECLPRNFCEMGQNCRVFGEGSMFVCSIAANMMSRWLATTVSLESYLNSSFARGAALEDCESRVNISCPVGAWNQFIHDTRRDFTC